MDSIVRRCVFQIAIVLVAAAFGNCPSLAETATSGPQPSQSNIATLLKPVRIDVHEMPLAEVITLVEQQIGISFQFDREGLAAEGVHPSTPVTISFQQPIHAGSALKLILEPLHLGYRRQGKQFVITSEERVEYSGLEELKLSIREEIVELCVDGGNPDELYHSIMTSLDLIDRDSDPATDCGSLVHTRLQDSFERMADMLQQLRRLRRIDAWQRGFLTPLIYPGMP